MKIPNKLLITLSVSLSLSLPAFSQEMTDQPLSETIQGTVKEKLEIQKAPPSIELELKNIIKSETQQSENVLEEAKPIPGDEDFDHYAQLNSNQTLKPWNPLIPEPPLVTFYPGLSKVASKRWEFRVSNQDGDIIKVIKGKGAPPKKVEWDGRTKNGTYITVGTLYSYQFLTFDEHKNSHTFPGEPFQLDALMYKQKGKLHIEFAQDRFFIEDEASIKPTMNGFWSRAVDEVRKHSNKPLSVEVHTNQMKSPLASERRMWAVDSLSNATNLPSVDIRHSVQKATERGKILRLSMNLR